MKMNTTMLMTMMMMKMTVMTKAAKLKIKNDEKIDNSKQTNSNNNNKKSSNNIGLLICPLAETDKQEPDALIQKDRSHIMFQNDTFDIRGE